MPESDSTTTQLHTTTQIDPATGEITRAAPYQLLPLLDDDHYQKLKADISARGVMVPVEYDDQGNILDGHHRVRAWQELTAEGMKLPPYPYVKRAFADEQAKRFHVRALNVLRRDLTKQQRNEQIVAMRQEGASERQIADATGVPKSTVNRVLATAPNGAVELPQTVKGKDGKRRAAKKNKPQDAPQLNLFVVGKSTTPNKDTAPARRQEKNERINNAADVPDAADGSAEDFRIGAVVRIGGHLLICGDNRAEWVRRITDEYEFALAFADPPYNAGVDEWDADFEWEQDYLADVARVVAVTPGIGNIPSFMRATAMPYKWSLATYINNGMTRGAVGFGNWMYTAIFSHGSVYRNAQDFKEISISGTQHSDTSAKRQKPTKYLAWLFDLFTAEGDVIFDPFAGSGSSVLVAHKLKRRCICVERDVETFRVMVATVRGVIKADAEVNYADAV
jgi:ParB-like chromosome segregation protein Spo0J/16S rRNA G966 N2-methylase RsmD